MPEAKLTRPEIVLLLILSGLLAGDFLGAWLNLSFHWYTLILIALMLVVLSWNWIRYWYRSRGWGLLNNIALTLLILVWLVSFYAHTVLSTGMVQMSYNIAHLALLVYIFGRAGGLIVLSHRQRESK
ncbi:hypothetical protein J5F27_06085 [Schleiferilactobacillus harbinensis]|uniref:Uncharacterized protein n=1 Tax=Schleiferilactobacillus harbinensis TaxID=304207 RepID=A0A510TXV7_9LACO|nr:hypothetical protein [Schleiferilactobacillus harbinensis]MBO3091489.1 hypothetical protein [Schleiferilactobacillus harbinensis]QEU48402.1 hypothetical protein FMM01_14390 [Schleiferilactobacillus harbinensis]QFR22236.1 hypothetical protein D1010_01570 [Schleiferilactobacillus harbinensis]GEK07119.1 hypothetical protein LHA01_23580 [Schleiferilactobacillus harbinensis]